MASTPVVVKPAHFTQLGQPDLYSKLPSKPQFNPAYENFYLWRRDYCWDTASPYEVHPMFAVVPQTQSRVPQLHWRKLRKSKEENLTELEADSHVSESTGKTAIKPFSGLLSQLECTEDELREINLQRKLYEDTVGSDSSSDRGVRPARTKAKAKIAEGIPDSPSHKLDANFIKEAMDIHDRAKEMARFSRVVVDDGSIDPNGDGLTRIRSVNSRTRPSPSTSSISNPFPNPGEEAVPASPSAPVEDVVSDESKTASPSPDDMTEGSERAASPVETLTSDSQEKEAKQGKPLMGERAPREKKSKKEKRTKARQKARTKSITHQVNLPSPPDKIIPMPSRTRSKRVPLYTPPPARSRPETTALNDTTPKGSHSPASAVVTVAPPITQPTGSSPVLEQSENEPHAFSAESTEVGKPPGKRSEPQKHNKLMIEAIMAARKRDSKSMPTKDSTSSDKAPLQAALAERKVFTLDDSPLGNRNGPAENKESSITKHNRSLSSMSLAPRPVPRGQPRILKPARGRQNQGGDRIETPQTLEVNPYAEQEIEEDPTAEELQHFESKKLQKDLSVASFEERVKQAIVLSEKAKKSTGYMGYSVDDMSDFMLEDNRAVQNAADEIRNQILENVQALFNPLVQHQPTDLPKELDVEEVFHFFKDMEFKDDGFDQELDVFREEMKKQEAYLAEKRKFLMDDPRTRRELEKLLLSDKRLKEVDDQFLKQLKRVNQLKDKAVQVIRTKNIDTMKDALIKSKKDGGKPEKLDLVQRNRIKKNLSRSRDRLGDNKDIHRSNSSPFALEHINEQERKMLEIMSSVLGKDVAENIADRNKKMEDEIEQQHRIVVDVIKEQQPPEEEEADMVQTTESLPVFTTEVPIVKRHRVIISEDVKRHEYSVSTPPVRLTPAADFFPAMNEEQLEARRDPILSTAPRTLADDVDGVSSLSKDPYENEEDSKILKEQRTFLRKVERRRILQKLIGRHRYWKWKSSVLKDEMEEVEEEDEDLGKRPSNARKLWKALVPKLPSLKLLYGKDVAIDEEQLREAAQSEARAGNQGPADTDNRNTSQSLPILTAKEKQEKPALADTLTITNVNETLVPTVKLPLKPRLPRKLKSKRAVGRKVSPVRTSTPVLSGSEGTGTDGAVTDGGGSDDFLEGADEFPDLGVKLSNLMDIFLEVDEYHTQGSEEFAARCRPSSQQGPLLSTFVTTIPPHALRGRAHPPESTPTQRIVAALKSAQRRLDVLRRRREYIMFHNKSGNAADYDVVGEQVRSRSPSPPRPRDSASNPQHSLK